MFFMTCQKLLTKFTTTQGNPLKKLFIVPALLVSTLLLSQEYKYEITPVIGYNIAEGNLQLDNQFLMGAELQYNTDTLIKPELSILYTDADYKNSSVSTDILRIALNGVYEYKQLGFITPLAKIGVGYETIDRHYAKNTDSAFVNAGVGAKIPFTDAIALKLEAVYMLKYNHDRYDNNLALLAGINFAFGAKGQAEPTQEEKPKTLEEPVVPVDGDDDNDGVPNSQDKCPNTPIGDAVDADGCSVLVEAAVVAETQTAILDDDNDGVANELDKCPNTPAGHNVDADGCSVDVNLHVTFKTASYSVDAASLERVKNFAAFLKERPHYTAVIVGHTDSTGDQKRNLKLSERRAEAVKVLLIQEGVEAQRVTSLGMGVATPIASNDTAEGREQNRRIEAKLLRK
jgi:OOP family OmpA-OmpF porin